MLTRLPLPHRVAPALVADLLESWFPADRTLVPSARLSRAVVRRCTEAGIDGGAVYDALVGLTVVEARRTLVTLDERAARTYRLLGVELGRGE